MSNIPPIKRFAIAAGAAAALALIAWGVFRPDFRPDPGTISPAMRQELAKTGFGSAREAGTVRLASTRSLAGATDDSTSEQRITPIDELLTERWIWTRWSSGGWPSETTGLYIGPLAVVRFHRTKLPIIGDLLPDEFWTSTRMSAFLVEEIRDFPGKNGGTMRARVTYEERYANGEVMQIENIGLQCVVTSVVNATEINPALSGSAARIQCNEKLEADGRKVGPANPQTWAWGPSTYAHWYILDRQWPIHIESENPLHFDGKDYVRRSSSKLISFKLTSR